uniref:Stromelysin-1 n=1 Tax=Anthurium amnicola TaxID=1678845 RepID=A0A1D1Z8H3_9ARAE
MACPTHHCSQKDVMVAPTSSSSISSYAAPCSSLLFFFVFAWSIPLLPVAPMCRHHDRHGRGRSKAARRQKGEKSFFPRAGGAWRDEGVQVGMAGGRLRGGAAHLGFHLPRLLSLSGMACR